MAVIGGLTSSLESVFLVERREFLEGLEALPVVPLLVGPQVAESDAAMGPDRPIGDLALLQEADEERARDLELAGGLVRGQLRFRRDE